MFDLTALQVSGVNVELSREERKTMANVLHLYCELDGKKLKIIAAVDQVVESLKDILFYCAESEMPDAHFHLPKLLSLETSAEVEE